MRTVVRAPCGWQIGDGRVVRMNAHPTATAGRRLSMRLRVVIFDSNHAPKGRKGGRICGCSEGLLRARSSQVSFVAMVRTAGIGTVVLPSTVKGSQLAVIAALIAGRSSAFCAPRSALNRALSHNMSTCFKCGDGGDPVIWMRCTNDNNINFFKAN